MDERDAGGYSVTYGREEIQAPVYFIAFLSAVLLAAAMVWDSVVALALGIGAAGVAYYNFPLIERRRSSGANQYGVFIQGLGLIRWSAIERIDLVEIAVRAEYIHELQIALKTRLSSALVADWRQLPFLSLADAPAVVDGAQQCRRRQSRAVQRGAGRHPPHARAAVASTYRQASLSDTLTLWISAAGVSPTRPADGELRRRRIRARGRGLMERGAQAAGGHGGARPFLGVSASARGFQWRERLGRRRPARALRHQPAARSARAAGPRAGRARRGARRRAGVARSRP